MFLSRFLHPRLLRSRHLKRGKRKRAGRLNALHSNAPLSWLFMGVVAPLFYMANRLKINLGLTMSFIFYRMVGRVTVKQVPNPFPPS